MNHVNAKLEDEQYAQLHTAPEAQRAPGFFFFLRFFKYTNLYHFHCLLCQKKIKISDCYSLEIPLNVFSGHPGPHRGA